MREIKLEVGMYVRTQKGIGKVVEHKKHESWGYLVKIIGQYSCYTHTSNGELTDVIKASHNPIDLIEEGDYVNGYKIDYINSKCETPFLRSNQPYRVDNTLYSTLAEKGKDYNQPLHFYNEDIKSIVTKEQFESMKYVIKEK